MPLTSRSRVSPNCWHLLEASGFRTRRRRARLCGAGLASLDVRRTLELATDALPGMSASVGESARLPGRPGRLDTWPSGRVRSTTTRAAGRPMDSVRVQESMTCGSPTSQALVAWPGVIHRFEVLGDVTGHGVRQYRLLVRAQMFAGLAQHRRQALSCGQQPRRIEVRRWLAFQRGPGRVRNPGCWRARTGGLGFRRRLPAVARAVPWLHGGGRGLPRLTGGAGKAVSWWSWS